MQSVIQYTDEKEVKNNAKCEKYFSIHNHDNYIADNDFIGTFFISTNNKSFNKYTII
jgi:hypothetical protein